jgi:signal peptide peptidase SppA
MRDTSLLRFSQALISEVWALHPAVLNQLCQTALEAQLPPALALLPPQKQTALDVRQGTALIPITGLLEKQLSYMGWIYGATLYPRLQDQIRDAAHRSDVQRVLLVIDSPGGTVAGTQETATLIRELAAVKPVVVHGSGMVASAAYWLAAQAHRLIVTPTTEVGSVGVVATHADLSKLEEKMGITFSEITSGPFKRIASMHAPLSPEGRAYLQEQVDTAGRLFAREVQAGRHLTEAQMADITQARTYIGEAAQQAGLVDQLAGFDQTLIALTQQSAESSQQGAVNREQGAINREQGAEGREQGAVNRQQQEEVSMSTSPSPAAASAVQTVEDLQRAYPELCQQLSNTATTMERERIRRISEIAPPALAAKAREYQFDNPLSAEAAGYELLRLQQQGNAEQLAAMARESPPVIPPAATPTGGSAPTGPQLTPEQVAVNKQLGLSTEDYLRYAS